MKYKTTILTSVFVAVTYLALALPQMILIQLQISLILLALMWNIWQFNDLIKDWRKINKKGFFWELLSYGDTAAMIVTLIMVIHLKGVFKSSNLDYLYLEIISYFALYLLFFVAVLMATKEQKDKT